MSVQHRVAVVIPALNEEGSIGPVVRGLIEGLVALGHTARVIVGDNGSTDDTRAVAEAAGADVVSAPERGYGSACLAALEALKDEDIVVWDDLLWGRRSLQVHRSSARIGLGRCLEQGSASNGLQPKLSVAGSNRVAVNDVTLHVHDLPLGQSGMFLTSPDAAFAPFAAGFGTLCLGGTIGRFNGPGQIQNSGTTGRVALPTDLTTGPVAAVAPGTTWTFQYWTRDGAASGLSSAIAVSFR